MGSFCSHHPDTRLFTGHGKIKGHEEGSFTGHGKIKGHEEGSLLPFQTRTTGFYQQLDTDYQKVEQSVRKN